MTYVQSMLSLESVTRSPIVGQPATTVTFLTLIVCRPEPRTTQPRVQGHQGAFQRPLRAVVWRLRPRKLLVRLVNHLAPVCPQRLIVSLCSDDVVDAAWNNGLGVHALIWFGWDDPNIWKTRRDALFASLFSNPKAKYVTRVLQFGSEPLFDDALSPADLAEQVKLAKEKLKPLGIPVTVSEMAWGYQSHGNATGVMEAIDMIDAHILPFFSQNASTGV